MTDTDCMDQIIAQAAAPLLSRAEERALFPLAQAGDAAAHERCVVANLRLVIAIAARYQHNGLELPDLIQEGTIGLMRAIADFDATRDIAFSTYATNWIRQAIQRAIYCRGRAIRLPVHVHETCAKARRAANQLAVDGQAADAAAIAAVSGISAQQLETLFALPDTTSLDAPHDRANGDPYTLAELIPAPETALEDAVAEADWHVYQRAQVTAALATLDERARFVLELRYGFIDGQRHTLEEVGQALGMTRERARQIEAKALTALRETAAACGLVGPRHDRHAALGGAAPMHAQGGLLG
jgi:RNA polymerase primary sigma factor